jgi:hypothetical protein
MGAFAVRRSPFSVHRSPFTVRRSPFAVQRSALTVRVRHLAGGGALILLTTDDCSFLLPGQTFAEAVVQKGDGHQNCAEGQTGQDSIGRRYFRSIVSQDLQDGDAEKTDR